MRWKIVAQYLAAFLIIAFIGNLVSSVVSSFVLEYTSDGRLTKVSVVATNPKQLDADVIKKIGSLLQTVGISALKDEKILYDLKVSNSWIQILNNEGIEIENINKPENIQSSYRISEIKTMFNQTIKKDGYNIYAVFAVDGGPMKDQVISESQKDIQQNEKEKVFVTGKSKDPSAAGDKDDLTEEEAGLLKEEKLEKELVDANYICIIGTPETKITATNVLYSLLDYFRGWTTPKKLPVTISTAITFLLTLLLGLAFSRTITRPVVKITDGIQAIAGGKYDIKYPTKGLYKQVYMSLNNTVETLKAAEVERKRVERMREELIVNLSHDLKTPLSSIRGYGELLLEPDYELTSEERKKYSEMIMNKTAYIEILMNDLKLMQRLKNNWLPLNLSRVNMVELLRVVVINLLNDPKYSKRMISFETDPEQIYHSVDPVLMQRAFTNLIHNAVVHNPENTSVRVSISGGDAIKICIEDNGKGISKEDQENLFERYYRGTNTEDSYAGSGLGLAIAKQVIEAHGGNIELESELARGTRITIKFLTPPHSELN